MSLRRTAFGLTLPQRATLFGAATWEQLLDLARMADRHELFESVWVGDSVMAKPRPDSLTLLGALSAVTTRVRLGVGCMASFALREPVFFAEQWSTLDFISKGRMQLAVCTGIGLGGTSAQRRRGLGCTGFRARRPHGRKHRDMPEIMERGTG